jgi:hypothetical protein
LEVDFFVANDLGGKIVGFRDAENVSTVLVSGSVQKIGLFGSSEGKLIVNFKTVNASRLGQRNLLAGFVNVYGICADIG